MMMVLKQNFNGIEQAGTTTIQYYFFQNSTTLRPRYLAARNRVWPDTRAYVLRSRYPFKLDIQPFLRFLYQAAVYRGVSVYNFLKISTSMPQMTKKIMTMFSRHQIITTK